MIPIYIHIYAHIYIYTRLKATFISKELPIYFQNRNGVVSMENGMEIP